jgi:hypothetical protein
MKLLLVRPNRDIIGYKPISISILSALAKQNKWTVKLFDTTYIQLGTDGYASKKEYEDAKIFALLKSSSKNGCTDDQKI